MESNIQIGLFGFGCVGQGLFDVLSKSRGFKSEIKKIVVKNKGKKRSLNDSYFSFDKNDILNDPEINLVVELIDNADEAFEIVSTALKNGKNVVTANKKMIAEHFNELLRLQEKTGCSVLYEAAACGSIPIIRNLEEYYDNELLTGVSGIFNGSSNYILSKMQNEKLAYGDALKQAQDLGFAESNPLLDVEGFDAKYKLIIVAGHTHGVIASPDEVLNLGINNLEPQDLEFAQNRKSKIRLIANTYELNESEITLYVTPQFIHKSDPLYHVESEFNAVVLAGAFSDKQLFIGKGAGGYPTGSAVLSDISANSFNYRYEYKKFNQNDRPKYNTNLELEVYLRGFDRLIFNTISEEGDDYAVGFVSLSTLISRRDDINASGAFLCSTGRTRNVKGKEQAENKSPLVMVQESI